MSERLIYNTIDETVFNTPIVRWGRSLPQDAVAEVYLKLEFFNPLGSVKDRVGRALVDQAEKEGTLTPETQIIEPTSGNTGIALAFVAASRGYRLTLTMPESMSVERRAILQRLGAEVVLTPASEGMRGAIQKATELAQASSDAWIPQQFENPANPAIHEKTTAPEIYEATRGEVDILVAGVGTGGTLSGTARYLKSRIADFKAIAVEPADSPVISGGAAGSHKIQGIGAGFIPKNLDLSLVDGVETVSSDEAIAWARTVAAREGLLVGISSGAALAASARLAQRPENRGKKIVTIIPSCGERYLSTILFEDLC